MCVKVTMQRVLDELSEQVKQLNEDELIQLINIIINSKQLFLAGAGRSGIMISAFANRLMHLGLHVNLINEITKPKANMGDLLIIGSGSGETASLVSYANKAKKIGVNIALITMNRESTLAKLADVLICLPNSVYKLNQPMGSTFEQLSLLTYDSLILVLMKRLNENSQSMQNRHANIE